MPLDFKQPPFNLHYITMINKSIVRLLVIETNKQISCWIHHTYLFTEDQLLTANKKPIGKIVCFVAATMRLFISEIYKIVH
jgi:hypothetical protein